MKKVDNDEEMYQCTIRIIENIQCALFNTENL